VIQLPYNICNSSNGLDFFPIEIKQSSKQMDILSGAVDCTSFLSIYTEQTVGIPAGHYYHDEK
jgi:hypothetical protein